MEYITHAEKIEVEAAFPRPETRYTDDVQSKNRPGAPERFSTKA